MRIKRKLLAITSIMGSPLLAQFAGNDNFDDNSLDTAKWTVSTNTLNDSLIERDERLEFNSQGSGIELQYLYWGSPGYDTDFELCFRSSNNTFPESFAEFASIGVEIYPSGTASTRLSVRHGAYYVNQVDFVGPSRDILANIFTPTSIPNLPVQPLTNFPKGAAIRVVFNSSTKVFSVYYDDVPTDGVSWTLLETFGIDSNSNGGVNYDFGMSPGNLFDVYVYARTDNMDADPGDLILDDFQAITGSPSEPTPTLEDAFAISIHSQLGKGYRVERSTDLSMTPSFAAVDVIGSGNTYKVVPTGEGEATFTGTGGIINILDTSTSKNEAFYRILSP
jgi:hypothetical protein